MNTRTLPKFMLLLPTRIIANAVIASIVFVAIARIVLLLLLMLRVIGIKEEER